MNTNTLSTFDTLETQSGLDAIYVDSSHQALAALNQYDTLATYRAFDDGGLGAVPAALEAYVDSQQRMWLW